VERREKIADFIWLVGVNELVGMKPTVAETFLKRNLVIFSELKLGYDAVTKDSRENISDGWNLEVLIFR
jgi:hypothetical protein